MKNIKKISINIAVLIILLTPVLLLAQVIVPPNPTPPTTEIDVKIENPLASATSLMGFINDILSKVIMPIAAVGIVVWIIWAGFQYLMAQGKPDAIKKANQNLMWSLIGAGILLGAAGISQVVKLTIEQLIQ